jgi:7-cyano-7-deazaguanine synthase in queuosine biosynthesis
VTEKKYAVIWSGGADSTLALTQYASYSSIQDPVRALTIVGHRQLDRWQLRNEKKAREAFLRWAKKRGYNIRHDMVSIDGPNDVAEGGQAPVWLSHLTPFIPSGYTVVFPYIKGDDFWHSKHEFVVAFNALSALMGVKRELLFPLEWDSKAKVLGGLKTWEVPDNCWWTCDAPKKNEPCGMCHKCVALKEARRVLVGERAEKKAMKRGVMVR